MNDRGPPVPALSRDAARRALTDMLRVRRLEERSAELYAEGKIRGFLHLCVGEEAIPAGVMPLLRAEDAVVATYREHGHALLRGIPMGAILAEMLGKREGCSRGHGGSMHLYDVSRRFYGGNGIVAGGLPLAVGLALADHLAGRRAVTACFFGEGAVAEGAFHESMNLASLWRLPVLFLCENNLYAMGTHVARSEAVTELCLKASGYAVPAVRADGMDVEAVASAVAPAVEVVRAGGGPRFVELLTYRFRAHSMFDPELYRSRAEVETWRRRDPVAQQVARLRDRGWLAEGEERALEDEAVREVEAGVAFAEAGTPEPVEDLLHDVCAPGQPT